MTCIGILTILFKVNLLKETLQTQFYCYISTDKDKTINKIVVWLRIIQIPWQVQSYGSNNQMRTYGTNQHDNKQKAQAAEE